MINQFKKINQAQKIQEVTPNTQVLPASKFQRTAKRIITTPDQSIMKSQKIQYITSKELTKQVKQISSNQRTKVLLRTNKLAEKTQFDESVIPEEHSSLSINSRQLQTQSKQNLALQHSKTLALKKQELPNNNIKRQQTKQLQEFKDNKLKKSQAIAHLLSRLRKDKLIYVLSYLNQSRKEKKIKSQVEAKLLIIASSQLAINFKVSFQQEFFNKLKNIEGKKSQQKSKIEVQILQSNSKKSKENLIIFLNIIFKIKLKQYFDKLKLKNLVKKNLLRKAPTLLDFYEKRKIRIAFARLKQISLLKSTIQNAKLLTISQVSKFFEKQNFEKGFMKLYLWASCKISANKVSQKQKSVISVPYISKGKNNQQMADEIKNKIDFKEKMEKQMNALEIKLKKFRKDQDIEKKTYQKKVQSLKNQKIKNQKEIQRKKNVNKNLKSQLSKHNILQNNRFFSQNDEKIAKEKLTNLQKIYFTFYRSQDQELASHISFLLRQHQIDVSSSVQIIEDWQMILKTSSLQRQINQYENRMIGLSSVTKQQNPIAKQLLQQNDILKSMIRNFIKQRYLWAEAKKYISSLV